MNPITIVAFAILFALLAFVARYCIKRGWTSQLLLTAVAVSAGVCVWIGSDQLMEPATSSWFSLALLGIGLFALVAVAVVVRRFSPRDQAAAA
ncbi:MAG TPA: hypothetical protein VGN72_14080 [Tepidisphaeraceae bacterium]|jgi:hypothetical protein|nr:hypothetical protein [Tepidisphaeraceae bacterium]